MEVAQDWTIQIDPGPAMEVAQDWTIQIDPETSYGSG